LKEIQKRTKRKDPGPVYAPPRRRERGYGKLILSVHLAEREDERRSIHPDSAESKTILVQKWQGINGKAAEVNWGGGYP